MSTLLCHFSCRLTTTSCENLDAYGLISKKQLDYFVSSPFHYLVNKLNFVLTQTSKIYLQHIINDFDKNRWYLWWFFLLLSVPLFHLHLQSRKELSRYSIKRGIFMYYQLICVIIKYYYLLTVKKIKVFLFLQAERC